MTSINLGSAYRAIGVTGSYGRERIARPVYAEWRNSNPGNRVEDPSLSPVLWRRLDEFYIDDAARNFLKHYCPESGQVIDALLLDAITVGNPVICQRINSALSSARIGLNLKLWPASLSDLIDETVSRLAQVDIALLQKLAVMDDRASNILAEDRNQLFSPKLAAVIFRERISHDMPEWKWGKLVIKHIRQITRGFERPIRDTLRRAARSESGTERDQHSMAQRAAAEVADTERLLTVFTAEQLARLPEDPELRKAMRRYLARNSPFQGPGVA